MKRGKTSSSGFTIINKKSLTRLNISLGGILVLLVVGTFFSKISFRSPTSKENLVRVTYHNPFEKSTQYENPFSEKENPIADLIFEEINK